MVGEQLIARYDEEDREPIPASAEARVLEELEEALPGADVVIACDYGAGGCTGAVRRVLTGLPLLVVDAHEITPWRGGAPAAGRPNYGGGPRPRRGEGDHPGRGRVPPRATGPPRAGARA